MSLMTRLSPTYTPPQIAARGSVAIIRDRILQTLLLGLLFLGAFALSAAVIQEVQRGRMQIAAVYAAVFTWVVFATLVRNFPYAVKAGSIALMAYILAISEIFDTSLLGEVRFWLFAFNMITALLLGFRPMLFSTAVSVITILVLGIGAQTGWIAIPYPQNFNLGTGWLVSGLIMAMVSLGMGLGTNALISGLQRLVSEREDLVSELESERESLEQRVEERTLNIQRRLSQMRTAAEISNAIGQISDPVSLFQQVVDLIQTRMGLYYVGLFIVDDNRQFANLRAGTGEAGQVMLARGHRLPVGPGSMIGWSIANHQARIALDVGEDAVHFSNPYLPLTRSELALPILSHSNVVGALTVQSTQANAFDQNDIIVLQGIADGLAASIENAFLVAELQQNLDELRALNRDYLSKAWSEVVDEQGSRAFDYDSAAGEGETSPFEFPINLRDQPIAHLSLEMEDSRLSADELAFLDAIATQTALALENARLVQETERRVVQEQKLNEMSARFYRANDIESILKAAVAEFGRLPSVSEASVQLVVGGDALPSTSADPSNGKSDVHS
jgi:GAF domain-containing protein